MNTINCRIQVDEYTNVPGVDVTPAEVLILRHLHTKSAKGDPIKDATRGGIALRNGQPRTDQEEHLRLRNKYPGKNPKTDRAIVEEILGNRFQALPQTFDELAQAGGLAIDIAERKPVTAEEKQQETTWGASQPGAEVPANPPTTIEEARALLLAKKKDELVKIATAAGVAVADTDTKAELTEKILANAPSATASE